MKKIVKITEDYKEKEKMGLLRVKSLEAEVLELKRMLPQTQEFPQRV